MRRAMEASNWFAANVGRKENHLLPFPVSLDEPVIQCVAAELSMKWVLFPALSICSYRLRRRNIPAGSEERDVLPLLTHCRRRAGGAHWCHLLSHPATLLPGSGKNLPQLFPGWESGSMVPFLCQEQSKGGTVPGVWNQTLTCS